MSGKKTCKDFDICGSLYNCLRCTAYVRKFNPQFKHDGSRRIIMTGTTIRTPYGTEHRKIKIDDTRSV